MRRRIGVARIGPTLAARLLVAALACVAWRDLPAQDTTRAQPGRDSVRRDSLAREAQRPAQRGVLVGTIADTAGRPLAGADVIVLGTAVRTRSRPDGRFTLGGVPAGDVNVVFRKLGYEATDVALTVVANTQMSLAVRLGPLAQALEAVNVSATLFNELGGFVVDAAGRPVRGADVTIDGSGRSARTREDGAFLFLDVAVGRYLMRVRKLGFTPQQRALEMVRQIERTITFRLSSLAQNLSAVEITAQSGFSARDSIARRDFLSRRRMAGSQSDLLTSEDLARSGRLPLSVAIRERALGWVKGGSACVLVDGDNRLDDVSGGAAERTIPGGQRFSVLQTIFADQVDAVEIYAENSENSRSACARFPLNSPCACDTRIPSVVIVWLKR